MFTNKWFKVVTLGMLVWSLLFAGGVGGAAAATGVERGATLKACMELVKEQLGTVLPGAWSSSLLGQCPRSEVSRASRLSATGAASFGWLDAGAGSVVLAKPIVSGSASTSAVALRYDRMTGTYLPIASGSATALRYDRMTGTYLPASSVSASVTAPRYDRMTGTYLPR